MSERERQKQTLLGLTEQLPEQSKKSLHPFSRLPEFKVQSSSTTNNFSVPTSLAFPSEELSVKLPLRFLADKAGIYATKIALACGDDVRDFDIEVHCITQNDNDRQTATLHMRTSVFTPVQQNIPIVSANDRPHPFAMKGCLFPWLSRRMQQTMTGTWRWPIPETKPLPDRNPSKWTRKQSINTRWPFTHKLRTIDFKVKWWSIMLIQVLVKPTIFAANPIEDHRWEGLAFDSIV